MGHVHLIRRPCRRALGRLRRQGKAEKRELEALDYWTSEASGTRYPVAWRLRAARAGLDLEVRPYLRDQEIDLSVRYWEGAVKIEGTARGEPIKGNGYLELAGY
jgi:predicted secreted hydrolase